MKPTYEQLEQQLAAVISERDAAVNAERIWEKTMMQACGEDGPASVSAEIAALRAQRDTALESLRQQLAAVVAVVAENAGLKESEREFNEYCRQECENAGDTWVDDFTETPETDAFLAEVRAQAIRDALNASSDYLDTDCVMDRLDISYEDAELRTSGAIELHDALVAIANELRQGAEQ